MFITDLTLVLVGSAALAISAALLKQPIIVAYILCGVLLGHWGLGWLTNVEFIETISHLGITLLLFLAGLYLHPKNLFWLFKRTTPLTALNSFLSFLITFGIAFFLKFTLFESLIIGIALMFSSTILAIKLLPVSKLNRGKLGPYCIGILMIQDLMAVGALAFVRSLNDPIGVLISFPILSLKVLGFVLILFLIEKFFLRFIIPRIEKLQEIIFVLGLAWCFGVASISNTLGIFHETGAFFAGVVLANRPITQVLSDKIKPLRDFFLVLFFFALGSKLDLQTLQALFIPSLGIALVLIIFKAWTFKKTIVMFGGKPTLAKEVGIRLAQTSEFSLLIAILALQVGQIGNTAAQLIQLVTIFTFILSSYWVAHQYKPKFLIKKMTPK